MSTSRSTSGSPYSVTTTAFMTGPPIRGSSPVTKDVESNGEASPDIPLGVRGGRCARRCRTQPVCCAVRRRGGIRRTGCGRIAERDRPAGRDRQRDVVPAFSDARSAAVRGLHGTSGALLRHRRGCRTRRRSGDGVARLRHSDLRTAGDESRSGRPAGVADDRCRHMSKNSGPVITARSPRCSGVRCAAARSASTRHRSTWPCS